MVEKVLPFWPGNQQLEKAQAVTAVGFFCLHKTKGKKDIHDAPSLDTVVVGQFRLYQKGAKLPEKQALDVVTKEK